MEKILLIIDELEFKYFEFNKLVTNFWLIHEFLKRKFDVYISIKSDLYLLNNSPYVASRKTFISKDNIFKSDEILDISLNDFSIIFFRPDPPVDIDYINASYILSYVKNPNCLIMNSPKAIREKNEKLYINEFQGLIPDNVVSARENIIKNFLKEKKEIIIKPTNRCFGSGVFYLNSSDKNINAILQTTTNNYTTQVMVQEFLPQISLGDKRLIYICGKLFDYCVSKVATNDDFKFNEHNSNTLKYACLTEKEKQMEPILKEKFSKDGIYLAGLDVIDNKIIEINLTSPCFFINEINNIFKIQFEKMIIDAILEYQKTFNNGFFAKI